MLTTATKVTFVINCEITERMRKTEQTKNYIQFLNSIIIIQLKI